MKDNITEIISFDDFKYSREFFNLKISGKYYLFIFLIAAFVVALIFWSFFFDYDVVVRSEATVRPSTEVSQIKAANSGIICVKNYKNGQKVHKGELLFSLDTTVLLSEIENTRLLQERNKTGLETVEEISRLINQNYIEENHMKDEAFIRASVYFSERDMKKFAYDKAESDYQMELVLPDGITYRQKILELKNVRDIAYSDLCNFTAEFQYALIQEKQNLQKTKEALQTQLFEYEQNLSFANVTAPISGVLEELTHVNVGDFVFSGDS